MKKVKNTKQVDYLHNDLLWNVGAVIEVSDDDAAALSKEGFEIVSEKELLKGDEL
jgi:hypothetical protein